MESENRESKITEFYRSEYQKLVRYVRGLIEDAAERDGEDIVQDVFLNIFNLADITIPIENLSAYVYQSLRNRVVDFLRKRRTDTVSLDAEVSEEKGLSLAGIIRDARSDTARKINKEEIRQRIFEAIESLSTDQKAVFIETEFNGRPFKELAKEWSVPLGTLLARKSRALKKIRIVLADSGGITEEDKK